MRVRTSAVVGVIVLVLGLGAMGLTAGAGSDLRLVFRAVPLAAAVVLLCYAGSHGVLVRRGKRYKRPRSRR